MQDFHNAFTPPSNRVLRWLIDPGPQVPVHLRRALLGEIFTSHKAVIMGVANGLLLDTVALLLHGGLVFVAFMVVDVVLATARVGAIRRAEAAAASQLPAYTDLYLTLSILWCGLQGGMALAGMLSGIAALQILSATTIMALIGPIAARYYPTPRLCFLLICLCDLPFVLGAALSRRPWLLVMILQTPLFLYGSMTLYARFRIRLAETLKAQHASETRARHDPLTQLLNRFGLTEALRVEAGPGPIRLTLFYLDLDGFKRVNDTCGHATGDKLLQAVADRLRGAMRGSDLVARIGGDEFVVVARGLPADTAGAFAANLIRRVATDPYVVDDSGPLRIGTSIGFACAPDDGTDFADLQRQADRALYAVKAAGKGAARRCHTSDRTVPRSLTEGLAGAGPA